MNALVQVPDVEDLTLVLTLHRTQSLGAAAREPPRQPARCLPASVPTRKALRDRLSSRVGSLGTTATPAGLEMVRQAEHILGHLHGVFAAVRSSAAARTLRVGTFAGISGYAFPALDEARRRCRAALDSGPPRRRDDRASSPRGRWTRLSSGSPSRCRRHHTSSPIASARTSLVAFVASGVQPPRRGNLPFLDRVVTYAPYDNSGPLIAERIAALGGTPRHAATAPVALEISRRRDGIAIVPSSAARMSGRPGDRVMASRVDLPVRLSVIARGEARPGPRRRSPGPGPSPRPAPPHPMTPPPRVSTRPHSSERTTPLEWSRSHTGH